MTPADGIGKLGFSRWYERQLIESHAYLTTCFLCMIVVIACVEVFSFKEAGLRPLLMLVGILGGTVLGFYAWTRYKNILFTAEHYADCSTCGQCQAYAKFNVIGNAVSHPARLEEADTPKLFTIPATMPVQVRCRKCGHEWTMP